MKKIKYAVWAIFISASFGLTAQDGQAPKAVPHYLDRYKPVVIFPMDQAVDSSKLTDSKGVAEAYIHNAEKGGMPKQVEGARPFLGKAWDFKGVDSCLVSKLHENFFVLGDIKNTKGISLSFWMKSDWHSKYNNHRIMGKPGIDIVMSKGRGTGGIAAHFGEYSISVNGEKRKRKVGVNADKRPHRDAYDGEWHQIVFTIDFTAKENNMAAYVDGREVARKTGFANKSFNTTNPRQLIVMGARSNRSYFFPGQLDDVAFFDYALTPEQVAGMYKGPVFAGLDKEIYLPNKAQLNGIAPAGKTIKWTRKTGPGEVKFQSANQEKTTAEFSEPGDYELQFAVQEAAPQTVRVKVNPPSPPQVIAGEPQNIMPGKSAKLQGKVTVPGWKDISGVKLAWTKVSGPGTVTFSKPDALALDAQFSEPGLYRLRLTADAKGLTGQDDVTVLVGKTPEQNYVQLLNPIYLFTLDQPANREAGGITDQVQGTCAQLEKPGDVLPQQTPGARPFTGNAWDFSKSTASLRVHNRFNVAELGNLDKTSGMSYSFWVKGPNYVRNYGRIGGAGWGSVMSVEPMHLGKGQAGIHGSMGKASIKSATRGEQRNLFDGQWHHVAIVSDFKSDQDNIKTYVDGNMADKSSYKFTNNFNDIRTDHSHFWGARCNGGNDPFKGHMDDIAAFNYPLSQEQVSYLFNGPNEEQNKLLAEKAPVVKTGKDQILKLPAQKVKLIGKVTGNNDLKYKWQLVKGPGPVTFSSPDKTETEVTFGPVDPVNTNNPDYREYVFRLMAEKTNGPVALSGSGETAVVFYKNHTPLTRKLSKVPPPGIHPRILFSPEDLPGMRERAKSDPYSVAAIKASKERAEKGLYNPKSPAGFIYQQLLEGKPDVDVKLQVSDGVADVYSYTNGQGTFWGQICGAAFVALIEDDQVKAKELAKVVANCAKAQLKYYRPNYASYLTHDASGALGLTYDFLYNYMSDEQRKPVRKLLSRMTKWRQSMGTGMIPPNNSTNWRTFHDHIVIAALAIEGEEGFDARLYRANVQKLRDSLTKHGTFRSGYGHEGWGYYNFGMTSAALTALATSRREENLYETTNLYNALLAQFRSMPPGKDWILSHGDTIGGQAGAGNLAWIGRFLWPNDPAIAYMTTIEGDKRLKLTRDKRSLNMMLTMFAVGPRVPPKSMKEIGKEMKLPLTLFCHDKGYVNTRSAWSDDALLLTFRCRMDKYFLGHMHPDVNSFELMALGHEWFTDPGKYSGPNDFHQTVLIDNIGGGGSSGAWTWPSLPGRFVEFKDSELMTSGSGDAKAFYDYVYNKPSAGSEVKKHKFPKVKDHGLIWADFVYNKTRKDPMPKWRMKPVGGLSPLIQYNPVKQAFRTAALIRGRKPYVLIVDDYQKDNKKHDYQWVANCRPKTVEKVSSNKTDLILKQKLAQDDGARLLVRVLQADGLQGGPGFEAKESFSGAKSSKPSARVLIDAKAVNPNYKVLIFPFKKGQALPKTKLTGNQLTIEWDDQKDVIDFKKNDKGRTRFKVNRK